MATFTLTLELPAEIVELLGSPEASVERMKQALVLELLRDGQISQGKAAQLLDLTRGSILDLMAQYQIPSGPATVEELRQEIDEWERFTRDN